MARFSDILGFTPPEYFYFRGCLFRYNGDCDNDSDAIFTEWNDDWRSICDLYEMDTNPKQTLALFLSRRFRKGVKKDEIDTIIDEARETMRSASPDGKFVPSRNYKKVIDAASEAVLPLAREVHAQH